MRKSGWVAAAGLVSTALLLTACGGSASSTGATGGSSTTSSATAAATASSGAQPTASDQLSSPPPGTVYFTVQKSSAGWVLAESGKAVYTFTGDAKGQAGTYTGSAWPKVKGQNPQVSSSDSIPGSFTVVGGQILYNGMPLYTYGSKSSIVVHPSSEWKLIPLSQSDIKS